MKTKLFTFVILLVVSLTAFAQQKKVAVYMTGPNSGINKVLGDQLVAAFSRSDKYIAIERTESFLAELGKEQNYQRTGAVSDNEISRLGKQFGVQLVCVVDVSEVFGQKYVSARVIDVERAEVVNTANTSSSLGDMDELMRVCNALKGQLFSDLADNSRVPKGYVDLGLPSGTYWQKSSRSGVFAYNQALSISSQSNAKIPSLEQWQELIDECTWTWKRNEVVEIQGKNGNTISLKKNRSIADEDVNNGFTHITITNGCGFWTSTKYTGKKHSMNTFIKADDNSSNSNFVVSISMSSKKEDIQISDVRTERDGNNSGIILIMTE